MATIADKVFNFIIEDKAVHQAVLKDLPEDKRAAVLGRKGRITITGPEGGVFTIRLTPNGVFREDDADDIRNEIVMSDSTMIEILVWLSWQGLKLPKDPGRSPRAAYVNYEIRISGESVLYDAEEIFKALEKHAFSKMGPIAKEAAKAMGRG